MLRRSVLLGLLGLAAGAAQAQVLPGRAPGFRPGLQFLSTDDVDAAAYIAALTAPPSAAERARLNALVRGLKADGVWTLIDRLNVLAAETQQAGLRDLRNPAKTLTLSGGVTFTADRGFTGDGTTGYLDLGEPFAFTGAGFVQNSATLGIWINVQSGTVSKQPIGNIANSARSSMVAPSSGSWLFRINDATDDVSSPTGSTRLGHRTITRTGAAVKRSFVNGALTAGLTTASVGVNTTNGVLLRNGGAYSDDRMAAFYSGAGLSDAQVAALHGRLNSYLSGKGAA